MVGPGRRGHPLLHADSPEREVWRAGAREHERQERYSWFDEGKATLAGRVRQINTGLHWAEEPLSRVCHIISNVQVGEPQGDKVRVQSRFFVYRNRLQDETDFFVGRRDDVLRRDAEQGWKIAKRTILLAQNVLLAKNVTIFF